MAEEAKDTYTIYLGETLPSGEEMTVCRAFKV